MKGSIMKKLKKLRKYKNTETMWNDYCIPKVGLSKNTTGGGPDCSLCKWLGADDFCKCPFLPEKTLLGFFRM
jgi:hypothetical protein